MIESGVKKKQYWQVQGDSKVKIVKYPQWNLVYDLNEWKPENKNEFNLNSMNSKPPEFILQIVVDTLKQHQRLTYLQIKPASTKPL